jgi:hypothetical protein
LKYWHQKLISISLVLLHKIERKAGGDGRKPQLQVVEDVLDHPRPLRGLELLLLDYLASLKDLQAKAKQQHLGSGIFFQHQGRCCFWPKPTILKCSVKAWLQIKKLREGTACNIYFQQVSIGTNKD